MGSRREDLTTSEDTSADPRIPRNHAAPLGIYDLACDIFTRTLVDVQSCRALDAPGETTTMFVQEPEMTPAAALAKLLQTRPSDPGLQQPALTPSSFVTTPTVTSPALTPVPATRSAAAPALTPTPGTLPALTPTPGTLPALTPAPLPALTPAPGTARALSAPNTAALPPGKVKGTLVISRMKYLRARSDEECERVMRRLSAADQQVLRGMLLPSSWYEGNLVVRLETTIVALLSRGERAELFLDMGRFTADTNLGPNGVQRPYLRVGDPHFLLRNVPRMYAAQHAGGVRTYEQLELKAAVIRTIEGEEPNAEDCLTAVGWLKRAVELAGGKVVTVEETTCRGRGHGCCEYVCRWV
jgi:hypothetical protein